MNKAKVKYNTKICVSSDYGELAAIRQFVLDKAVEFGFNDDEAFKISLAVDEACTNLVKHSYKFDSTKQICVFIELNTNQFIVNILDEGTPFNPSDFPTPDMTEYLSKHRRGGLGIHLMRSVMDDISYIPSNQHNPHNTLKLKKILS